MITLQCYEAMRNMKRQVSNAAGPKWASQRWTRVYDISCVTSTDQPQADGRVEGSRDKIHCKACSLSAFDCCTWDYVARI